MSQVIIRQPIVGDVYDFGVIHELRPFGFMQYITREGTFLGAEQRLIHNSSYLGSFVDFIVGLRVLFGYENSEISNLIKNILK